MKAYFLQRLFELQRAFPVLVYGYAAMDNHLHLLIRFEPERIGDLEDEDAVGRWVRLFPGACRHRLDPEAAIQQRIKALLLDPVEVAAIRGRLRNLSAFLKALKQPMAERYNRLTGQQGSLFQGRCSVTAPQNDQEALAMWAYIECNPFAAGLCEQPEAGAYTSLEARAGSGPAQEGERTAGEDASSGTRVRAGRRVLVPLPGSGPGPREAPRVSLSAARDADGRFRQPPLHERVTLSALRAVVRALAAKLREGKRVLKVSGERRLELALEAAREVFEVSNPKLVM